MKEYFEQRLRMLNRHFTEIGLPPVFVYLLLPILFYYFSNEVFNKIELASILYYFVAIILIFQSYNKRRNDFIKMIFSKTQYYVIRNIENLLLSSAFALFLIYKHFYITSLLLVVTSIFLSFVNFKNNFSFSIKTPFFKHPYEFCIGYRKSFLLFIAAYFLTFMSIKHNNINLGYFAIILIQFTCLQFYTKLENTFYIWIFALSPKEFLKYKFKIIIYYSTLLCLPIVISLVFFYPYQITVILGIQMLSYFIIFTGMLAKYAAYPDSISIKETIIFALLVWFPPLLILLLPYFYYQSIKKLKTILL